MAEATAATVSRCHIQVGRPALLTRQSHNMRELIRRSPRTAVTEVVWRSVALILLLYPNLGLAAPIVFDFEDGLQGWTSSGATRQEVDFLGGKFAIFGVDGARMTIELDLTNIQAMSIE